jgi:hypothetical protein
LQHHAYLSSIVRVGEERREREREVEGEERVCFVFRTTISAFKTSLGKTCFKHHKNNNQVQNYTHIQILKTCSEVQGTIKLIIEVHFPFEVQLQKIYSF